MPARFNTRQTPYPLLSAQDSDGDDGDGDSDRGGRFGSAPGRAAREVYGRPEQFLRRTGTAVSNGTKKHNTTNLNGRLHGGGPGDWECLVARPAGGRRGTGGFLWVVTMMDAKDMKGAERDGSDGYHANILVNKRSRT
ncbi:hypothetical protein HYALB_00011316 [Hymenoscyphus albidus]|uniref:Uncharacterized protein n=1 Tax=Hymenoscyphus albidus TaxID=595503 RepID=A0A9N9Q2C0_9HELO|nr:hypothetical protein HYALB_00011316 [Hymenoscyphus albidus]